MAGPFDDPEVKRLMRDNGIVHKPGLAADLLREVGPLLAADGIDVNHLGDVDMDTLNDALGRAVERRNMELFTPVGDTRNLALAALRLTAEAINEGNTILAHAILDSIHPEPADNHPSVGNLIGVSLSTLDTWHADPALTGSLRIVRIPVWDKKACAAGVDIVALARKRRAFDSISGLHRHHDGLSIMHGSVLAITGTLQTWAAHENRTVGDLALQTLASP